MFDDLVERAVVRGITGYYVEEEANSKGQVLQSLGFWQSQCGS